MKKLILAGVFASFSAPAFAGANVNVFLWDSTSSMDMVENHRIEDKPDRLTDVMGVTANVHEVPAGEITFNVVNTSPEAEHEMVVTRLSGPDGTLPYDAEAMRVDEEAAGSAGEVSELPPGQSGALTVTLEPGTYVLYCNIPGHYAAGMWTEIVVK